MGFEDEAYGDPFSGLSSSDVGGPTTPPPTISHPAEGVALAAAAHVIFL